MFSILLRCSKFSEKLKPSKDCKKNWSTVFYLKVVRPKMCYFHTKLPCQKSMLRQVEWEVKNEFIMKNGILPATTLVF